MNLFDLLAKAKAMTACNLWESNSACRPSKPNQPLRHCFLPSARDCNKLHPRHRVWVRCSP